MKAYIHANMPFHILKAIRHIIEKYRERETMILLQY